MNFVQSSCSIWLRIRRGILYTYDELATAEESEWIPASRCYQLEPPQHFLSLPPILPITSFPTYHLATMSRRPDPARAAQNQQTIKNLLKLESNKTCADCKRNKRTDHDSLSATFLLRLHHIARFSATILIVSFLRSTMGLMESRYLHLHPLLRHPQRDGHPCQPSQIG